VAPLKVVLAQQTDLPAHSHRRMTFGVGVGDYRIAFTVNFEKSEVVIVRVSRREKFY